MKFLSSEREKKFCLVSLLYNDEAEEIVLLKCEYLYSFLSIITVAVLYEKKRSHIVDVRILSMKKVIPLE